MCVLQTNGGFDFPIVMQSDGFPHVIHKQVNIEVHKNGLYASLRL